MQSPKPAGDVTMSIYLWAAQWGYIQYLLLFYHL